MNGALLEAFRHNSWATRQLLAFCRDLSEEQLAASATGAYRSIRATELDELAARAEEAGQLWERLLSEPVDTERVVVVDGALEVRAGVIVAQALRHGNAHREQICAILTSLGIEPPDIQPWGTRGRPDGSGNEPLRPRRCREPRRLTGVLRSHTESMALLVQHRGPLETRRSAE